jgi:uncharacterized protein
MLYTSVGHAGGTGYLAAMALFGVAPAVMRPTALTLNILVACIASIKYYRAGLFSWRIYLPFALTAVPFAFVGGMIVLPGSLYRWLVGIVLLYTALRLILHNNQAVVQNVRELPIWAALITGSLIGLLAGMTGAGGGVFLGPLLLFMNWAEPRQISGVTALFILTNSIAGLAGHITGVASLPPALPLWAIAAVCGGWIGSEYGKQGLNIQNLRKLLALVLVIAGLRMFFL